MKIVVIGGTGLIGSKVVKNLIALKHEAVAASPASGVNTLTGEGLAGVLESAQVVVDVSNSPSFADAEVMSFFLTSTRNLLEAEKVAGVKHHVALTIVGAERMPDSGYMRAKVAQEAMIIEGGVPYSILRATQFFEFIGRIADSSVKDGVVHLPAAMMQPLAADDVARVLTDVTVEAPTNGITDVAGPEPIRLDALARQLFAAKKDARTVLTDPSAGYFGAKLDDQSLVPTHHTRVGEIRYADWLTRT